jgi:hypothetical protein
MVTLSLLILALAVVVSALRVPQTIQKRSAVQVITSCTVRNTVALTFVSAVWPSDGI